MERKTIHVYQKGKKTASSSFANEKLFNAVRTPTSPPLEKEYGPQAIRGSHALSAKEGERETIWEGEKVIFVPLEYDQARHLNCLDPQRRYAPVRIIGNTG
ncbi:hypothetical protein PoB_005010900 [Plakobranchus ocellatus]|uniref:Uncharacterized protein n=1 Tax=Plakobranchus ocellatus TaxID=259542 RepID=A0AAV4BXR5_9GAST|nr:hypothetical protein PoB_005010900 [Plakobranchus ocellatus]